MLLCRACRTTGCLLVVVLQATSILWVAPSAGQRQVQAKRTLLKLYLLFLVNDLTPATHAYTHIDLCSTCNNNDTPNQADCFPAWTHGARQYYRPEWLLASAVVLLLLLLQKCLSVYYIGFTLYCTATPLPHILDCLLDSLQESRLSDDIFSPGLLSSCLPAARRYSVAHCRFYLSLVPYRYHAWKSEKRTLTSVEAVYNAAFVWRWPDQMLSCWSKALSLLFQLYFRCTFKAYRDMSLGQEENLGQKNSVVVIPPKWWIRPRKYCHYYSLTLVING